MTHDTVSGKSVSAGAKTVGSLLGFLIFIEVTSGFVQGFYTPLLPDLARHVGVSEEAMNWFQTAQAMAAAVMVPLLSKMGDVFGPRKILRGAVVSVLLGTLVIALVPSYAPVLIGRVLMGPLGVWLPLVVALVYVRSSGQSATRSISILSASVMGGVLLGTITSGLVGGLADSIVVALLVPSLLVAVSTFIVFFVLPKDIDLSRGSIDWVGFAGFGGLILVVILAAAFLKPRHQVLPFVLLAAVLIGSLLWVMWEKRVPSPAVNLKMATSRAMGPLYLAGFFIGIVSINASPNLVDFLSKDPAIYTYGFNATSTLRAGLVAVILIFATLGGISSSFVAAKLGMRRTLIGGALLGALGQALLLPFPHTLWMIWVSGIITGIGLGLLMGALPALVAHAAPEGQTGAANGIYSALVAMGGAVGGAVFKQVLVASRDVWGRPDLSGYMLVWGISVCAFLIAMLMMMWVDLGGRKPKAATGS